MTTIKKRIERLEEKQWQKKCEALDSYLAGRSWADVEFFIAHGYLPEVPTPGDPYTPCPVTWEEHKSLIRGRSEDEMEFFCVHGYWPDVEPERVPIAELAGKRPSVKQRTLAVNLPSP